MQDYLKVIKLGYGKGEPGKQACWMTALQSHLDGDWTDRCKCVDLLINKICILANDAFGQDNYARTNAIMEFGLFAPLGTKGTDEQELARCERMLEYNIKVMLPILLPILFDYKDFQLEELYVARDGNYFLLNSKYYILTNDDERAAINKVIYAINSAMGLLNTCKKMVRPTLSVLGDYAAFSSCYIRLTVELLAVFEEIYYYRKRRSPRHFNSAAFVEKYVFPILRELIDMGPKAPEEPAAPVCGIPKFHELVGVKKEALQMA